MATYYTSQLGWKAGQDVSSHFAGLVKSTLKAGDRLVLDHSYKIGGSNLQLPNNFTLEAAKGGGLQVIDSATNGSPLLLLGHGNTLKNLTISHPNSPSSGAHAKRTIVAQSKDDVSILNSKITGNVSILVDIMGGKRLSVDKSWFEGGTMQLRLIGSTLDTTISNSLFKSSLGDGIKTERGGGYGPQRVKILDSVFEGHARDGIDTAGGFKDSLVSGSIFRGNKVAGIDVKTLIERSSDISTNYMNKNIEVVNSQFIDNQNHMVFTTLDRAGLINKSNANAWAVQQVRVKDSIFEKTAGYGDYARAFLVKDAHSIYWDNIKLLGGAPEVRTVSAYDWGMPHTLVGTNVGTGAARAATSADTSQFGPGASTSTVAPPPSSPEPVEPVEPSKPAPEGDDFKPVFERSGDLKFTGKNSEIVNIPHSSKLAIDEGAFHFRFAADRVDQKLQGLVVKDAYGYEGGGHHFAAYLGQDSLVVRFQDASSEQNLIVRGIKAKQKYEVLATFDEDTIKLYVDDKLVASRAFDMDLSKNGQWMQIGGLGWASASGSNSASHAFHGVISDVAIFDQAVTPPELTEAGWV